MGRYLTATVFWLIVGCHFVDGSLTDHLRTTDTWSMQLPIPTGGQLSVNVSVDISGSAETDMRNKQ